MKEFKRFLFSFEQESLHHLAGAKSSKIIGAMEDSVNVYKHKSCGGHETFIFTYYIYTCLLKLELKKADNVSS